MGPATTPMIFCVFERCQRFVLHIVFAVCWIFLFRPELNCLKLNWWAGEHKLFYVFYLMKTSSKRIVLWGKEKAHSANAIFGYSREMGQQNILRWGSWGAVFMKLLACFNEISKTCGNIFFSFLHFACRLWQKKLTEQFFGSNFS